MAQTTICDFVIWAKHVHGDSRVVAAILSLKAGEVITATVDRRPGLWRKMDDGRDGRPTAGIRPIGQTAEFWRSLYRERRGQLVSIEVLHGGEAAIPLVPSPLKTEAERRAAIESFLSLAGQGWRSDGPYGPRDEIYNRE